MTDTDTIIAMLKQARLKMSCITAIESHEEYAAAIEVKDLLDGAIQILSAPLVPGGDDDLPLKELPSEPT